MLLKYATGPHTAKQSAPRLRLTEFQGARPYPLPYNTGKTSGPFGASTDHRSIDVVIAALPVGVAGALIVFVLEDKLKKLRSQGRSFWILAIIGLLILVALALVNSRLVDFVVPIPVPAVHIQGQAISARQALIKASILGSVVVWYPLFIALQYRKSSEEPLFGQLFQYIFLLSMFIMLIAKSPGIGFDWKLNKTGSWALGFAAAGSTFLQVDNILHAESPPKTRFRRTLLRILRGLSFVVIWTASIVEAWA